MDFADEMWRELYVLNDQLTRRFIQVLDIVRVTSSRSICFTKVWAKFVSESTVVSPNKTIQKYLENGLIGQNFRIRHAKNVLIPSFHGILRKNKVIGALIWSIHCSIFPGRGKET